MSRSGTIIEHMTEMGPTTRASYLIACHSSACVCGYSYFISGQRRIETGPASAGLKFRVRAKQLVSARSAEINSFFVIVPIRVFVWRLCFGLAQDLKLAGSQDLSPLGITQHHLLRHWSRLDLAPDSSGLCVFRHAEVDG
jgi:hypothetical protein